MNEKYYKILDDFLKTKLNSDQAGFAVGGGSRYLAIQTCEDGYDYTFYDKDFKEIDGGQIDNRDLSMAGAICDLFASEGVETPYLEYIDYEKLMLYIKTQNIFSSIENKISAASKKSHDSTHVHTNLQDKSEPFL